MLFKINLAKGVASIVCFEMAQNTRVSEHKLDSFKNINLAKGVASVSEHKLDSFRLCE